MKTNDKISVLFVCMGNICRSPTAHGVFRQKVREAGLGHLVEIDSAGTHAYHVGNPPDRRAQETALSRGLDLADLRARQVTAQDFARFDYVLAMDNSNMDDLLSICPTGYESRIQLFLSYGSGSQREVPDPYYGQGRGFEIVLNLVDDAAEGLLKHIQERL